MVDNCYHLATVNNLSAGLNMMTLNRFFVAIVITFLLSSHIFAKNIELFAKNPTTGASMQVDDYDTKTESLLSKDFTRGDTIQFSNGTKFVLESLLGTGNLSVILKIKDGDDFKAIRIPKYKGKVKGLIGKETYVDQLKGYESAFNMLNKYAECVSIKSYPDKSLSGEYLMQDITPIKFTFDELKYYLEKVVNNARYDQYIDLKLSKMEIEEIKNRLIDFAKKSALIISVNDFHGDQLVYTGEKWLILDGATPIDFVTKHDYEDKNHVLSNLISWDSPFGDDFADLIDQAVNDTRKKWARGKVFPTASCLGS